MAPKVAKQPVEKPEYLEHRIQMFDKLKQEYDQVTSLIENLEPTPTGDHH